MIWLLANRHEIIRNALSIEPAIPGLSRWSDDSGTPLNDDVHLFDSIRVGNWFWKSYGLTLVALENACSLHLWFDLYKYIPVIHPTLEAALGYVNGISHDIRCPGNKTDVSLNVECH